jgi:hypothetical protein
MTFPVLIFGVAFSAAASTGTYGVYDDPARGRYDTATYAPADLFSDITADLVAGVSISRGSRRVDGPIVRYEAGTLAARLNNSTRVYDPTNLAGPYVVGGETRVTPMRPVYVRATHDGITYDLFRGNADSWQADYDEPDWSEVALRATDAVKILANLDRIAVGAVGAGELTGTRVGRILDSAGWGVTDRIIAAGDSTVQATTLDGAAWTELMLAADSEIGEVYIDAAGRVVFRNRNAMSLEARSATSQATFGDDGLRYESVGVEYDDTTIRNLVRVSNVGGSMQTAQDTVSQTKNLVHTFDRTDLILESDGEAAAYAGFVLYIAKDAELRFTELVINPRLDEANLFPQVLGRQMGDRITVKLRPPGGGDVISRDVFIRGITHDITDDSWQTTFTLQSATKFAFGVYDSATLGLYDSAQYAF